VGVWTRRMFLRLGATSVALASAGCGRRAARTRTNPVAVTPRYVVIVYLDGGIDPVLTTDPRTPDQVAARVDVPLSPDEIVNAGAIRLGPHFAPLAPWASRMAIINGVHVDTANHNTGWAQISRLRTRVFGAMPGILDIIGEYRDGQPLSCISFNTLAPAQYSPGHVDASHVFDLQASTPDQLRSAAAALKTSASSLEKLEPDRRVPRTRENYRSLGLLAERLAEAPRFDAAPWDGVNDAKTAAHFQQLLWALEHDITRCAFVRVCPYSGWDSHNNNLIQQRNCSRAFTDAFVRFLRELDVRKNAHGALAAQTMIVAASEIGRFPLLNGNAGKDHFPECPVLFLGPGIETGSSGAVYGATDDRMAALPIDLASGRRAQRGGHKIRLDDIGATVLEAAGVSPEACGYGGKVLPFLRARA
jgi:hypothetical protein